MIGISALGGRYGGWVPGQHASLDGQYPMLTGQHASLPGHYSMLAGQHASWPGPHAIRTGHHGVRSGARGVGRGHNAWHHVRTCAGGGRSSAATRGGQPQREHGGAGGSGNDEDSGRALDQDVHARLAGRRLAVDVHVEAAGLGQQVDAVAPAGVDRGRERRLEEGGWVDRVGIDARGREVELPGDDAADAVGFERGRELGPVEGRQQPQAASRVARLAGKAIEAQACGHAREGVVGRVEAGHEAHALLWPGISTGWSTSMVRPTTWAQAVPARHNTADDPDAFSIAFSFI